MLINYRFEFEKLFIITVPIWNANANCRQCLICISLQRNNLTPVMIGSVQRPLNEHIKIPSSGRFLSTPVSVAPNVMMMLITKGTTLRLYSRIESANVNKRRCKVRRKLAFAYVITCVKVHQRPPMRMLMAPGRCCGNRRKTTQNTR